MTAGTPDDADTGSRDTDGAGSETPDEILTATYRALCEHGYADLTMQRIADESSLTTAAIHYHFDTKAELLEAFLDELLARFEDRLATEAEDPRERLEAFLDAIFEPVIEGDVDFPVAMLELKAQAPYDDAIRRRFVELDERMREVVAEAVRDGVEAGHFEAADPETVARFVVTVIDGGHSREVALGADPVENRRLVAGYLQRRLGWRPEVAS